VPSTLEQTYQKLTQREHVLKRPDTYVGSVKPIITDMWVLENPRDLNNIKIVKKSVKYTPAFIKIFDEILTNASDHYWRTKSVKKIKITFDGEKFEVYNDGQGIPIKKHKKERVYIPELIFGHLLAGSNFNDDEVRFGGGRNGLGAKLTNIFSTKFIVETADGIHKYRQSFQQNMHPRKKGRPSISETNRNYTKVKYWPDWEKFEMTELDDDTLSILLKRIIDVAAYCPAVQVSYNGKVIPIKSIKDWMTMHLEDETDFYYDKLDKNWEIGVAKSSDSIFDQISVVNGISTHRGGTHINKISMELSKIVYEQLAKKHKKLKFTWNNVKSNLFLFVIAKVPNPTFDTQTKEYLTTTITKEILDLEFKDQFIKKIVKSDICQTIIDWIEARELQELNRQSKKLKKIKVAKLIDAKSTKNTDKELFIFEGLSALSSFRKFRDPQTQGAFPLKGKFINVSEIKASKVIENEEAKNLIASIGLHIGQEVNEEELRYKKIYITADADVDGDAISALLINFFYKFWPELFEQKRIYKVYTPLMVAKNGKRVKYFYNEHDFEKWAQKTDLSKWNLEYKKGLASLEDVEYKDMIRNPYAVEIKIDNDTKENLSCWFGNNSKLRKEKLLT